MRTVLSTIQQTLTPEAASVLTRSISEAARRSHGQTTPLHVAATLLATPSGLLRQACVRSHPQSSHPLQCRALELCFSVALDRLPGGGAGVEPPISNALMAALKRAQANQRRGCPEQQQQPLLAVKVELEQLLISILDDPSVSRVMREASFSSVAVKIAIEQSLPSSASTTTTASARSIASFATGTSPPAASRIISGLSLTNRAPPCHSLYINPRLYQHQHHDSGGCSGNGEQARTEEVKRVLDVLSRFKNRNPILVGDSNADVVMREVLQRIRSGDAPPHLLNAQVLPFPKEIATASSHNLSQIIRELSSSFDSLISSHSGMIIHLGDLKWLVESHGVSDASQSLTEEIGKLLKTFQKGDQVWLIGTASCETYLRCQIHHPTMENDWDLQPVPIAPSSSITNTFPRIGGDGILSNSLKRLSPMNCTGTVASNQPSEIANPSQNTALCPICSASYQHELTTLGCTEFNKPSTKAEASQAMPQWLQIAMLDNGSNTKPSSSSLLKPEEEQQLKESTEELLKRWAATCSSLHPTAQSTTKLELTLSQSTTAHPTSPPCAPVRTDLVLGNSKLCNSSMADTHNDCRKDFNERVQDTIFHEQRPKVSSISDIDSFKRLFKGLADKVSCQQEAALAVATAVLQCKSGNGRRRKTGTKGDIWLLLIGPDKVGKRKMASALSELIFGIGPTFVSHSSCTEGDHEESTFRYRGRTPIDRIVEAVCQNPFSVIVLEDIDRADMIFQGKIRQGIERGRLLDSHGREISLGSVIFVLTTDWVSEDLKSSYDSLLQHEEKVLDSAYYGVGLELSIGDKLAKRRPDWLREDDQCCAKQRKESLVSSNLSLDLNLPMGIDAEGGEGSRNSSDLTTEHECDKGRLSTKCFSSPSISELPSLVDETIAFKPVDFGLLRRNVLQSTSVKFAAIMGKGRALRIDDDALDRIVAGLWLEGADFEDWAERVLVPSLKQLRNNNSKTDAGVVVIRLSTVKGDRSARRPENSTGNWLPATITIAFDGADDNQ